MLEGLFDADRWSTTFQNMGPFWEGFGVTLQVVVAGLLLSLVLGTLLGFVALSSVLLGVAMKLMLKAIRKGPVLDAQDRRELKTSPYALPQQTAAKA